MKIARQMQTLRQWPLSSWLPLAVVWVLILLSIGGLADAVATALDGPVYYDTSMLVYIAHRILAGDVPYRDVLDMNLPGTYLLYMLAQVLFGLDDAGFRCFDMIFAVFAGTAVGLYGRRAGISFVIFCAMMFMAFHISAGGQMVGQRDFLMLPLLLFPGLLVNRALENPSRRYAAIFLSGMLLGLALWMKPHALIWGVMLACIIAWECRRQWRLALKIYLAMGAGVFAVSMGMLSWVIALGAWPGFVEMITQLIPLYANSYFIHTPAQYFFVKYPALLALVLLVVAAYIMERRLFDRTCVMLILGILYGCLHMSIQKKGWPHHFYPLAAFLGASSAYLLARLITYRSHDRYVVCVSALLMLCGITASVMFVNKRPFPSLNDGWSEARVMHLKNDIDAAYDALDEELQAQGKATSTRYRIQFFGYGDILKAAYKYGWKNHTNLFYHFPFAPAKPSAYATLLQQSFAQKLKQDPPDVLVINDWPGARRRIQMNRFVHPVIRQEYRSYKAVYKYEIWIRRAERK